MTDNRSQCQRILDHLSHYHFITPLTALTRYGCFRLAARIKDLRDEGHDIETEMVNNEITGKRYAKYFLVRRRYDINR